MRAAKLKEGMKVRHSDEFHNILAVKQHGPFVTCITEEGGRISFLATDKVVIS